MGISGLLPLLKSIHKPCNLKKFAGQTIGVDAYGWLHRGAVACAIDLALGKPTKKYVDFSMNRVRMLLHFGVIPYLVFDGDYLPSKAGTEVERAKRREESKKKGLELYHMNKPSQAHLELQKAVDVTPVMARQLIEELKKAGIQYVVAPYEADAQLVYLEKKDVIKGILSEDSDLLVFGAKRLLTKLDQYGDCIQVDRADFTACREISLFGWTDVEFRRMAILSGCDYLASISGMGLKNAYRFVRKYKTIEKIVRMLQFDGKYHVPPGYLEAFHKAELTFLHQRVFCPLQGGVVSVNPIDQDASLRNMSFIGAEMERSTAAAVARGDLDPVTKAPIIIPALFKDSPKTPWNFKQNQNEATAILEVKENKSLDTFFKPKRKPLAELDPNTFTPSPTQERLLQQARAASWDSQLTSIATSAIHREELTPASTSQASLSKTSPTCAASRALTGPTPSKRPRILREMKTDTNIAQTGSSEEIRSRFFLSGQNSNLLSKPRQNPGKAKVSKTNLRSDESVEAAMAELIKSPDESKSPEEGKLDIVQEKQQKLTGVSARTQPREEFEIEQDSQTSTSSILCSGASISTAVSSNVSSASSTAETLAKSVSADFAALTADNSCPQRDKQHLLQQGFDLNQQEHSLDKTPNCQPSAKLAPLQKVPMSALQRLRAHALTQSKSYSAPMSLTSPKTHRNVLIEDDLADLAARPGVRKVPSLPLVCNEGADISTAQGSEDNMVPDSEDDLSDSSPGNGACSRPRFSLGQFTFNG